MTAEYEQEVFQKLLDQPTWNSLFNLNVFIRQYTAQVEKLHNPVQEDIFDTQVLDDKVVEQLGVKLTYVAVSKEIIIIRRMIEKMVENR